MYKFNYHSPASISESLEIFRNSEDPKYLAGGMTLLAAMKQKMSSPTDLIDLSNISGLKKIETISNKIFIGSMNTHNEIAKSEDIKNKLPGFAYLAKNIADNAVRNRGTIGGSICNADPAADYPAALLCLSGEIVTNERKITSTDFFVDMFETKLKEEEMVVGVELQISEISKYYKFSSLASKYAIVGLFVAVKNDLVKFSVTGASNCAFIIKELDEINIKDLHKVDIFKIDLNKYFINSDIHASTEYRISLLQSQLKDAIDFLLDN